MQISVNSKESGPNPYTKICHICGRQFGSQSLAIHQKACAEKWHKDQSNLPKSKRLPLPPTPIIDQRSAKNDNDAAFEIYQEHSRKECPNCYRKFAIDRLEIHLKSCSPGGFFARKNQERLAKCSDKDETSDSLETLNDLCISNQTKSAVETQFPSKIHKPVKNTTPKSASYCTDCGTSFTQSTDNFCGNCGKKRN